MPTDSYDLADAIAEGYLVPPVGKAVSTQFLRQGIRYDELSESDKDQWDLADWHDDDVPEEVDADDVNKWLFNADTVDKVLATLMTEGRKVGGGDKLAKTIIFARTKWHADFISQRFDLAYPHYAGHFAQVIVHGVSYAQNLIDNFSQPDKFPQVAISVDMLDTGIDVPEVANLVFFKPVHSKTKYWQMVGRGTRLRADLYGPGEDKQDFVIFDVCQNIEYFSQEMVPGDGPTTPSLGEKIFATRVELINNLDRSRLPPCSATSSREALRAQIDSMNVDNFVVRPHREIVERFRKAEAWAELGVDDQAALVRSVAGLPHGLPPEAEESKRFDLLILSLQLSLLRSEPGFERLRAKVVAIAGQLQAKDNIPAVAAEIELIDALVGDEWWVGVNVDMLEHVRKRLRRLVALLESEAQAPLYTDFRDQMLTVASVDIADLGATAVLLPVQKEGRGVPARTPAGGRRAQDLHEPADHDRRHRRAPEHLRRDGHRKPRRPRDRHGASRQLRSIRAVADRTRPWHRVNVFVQFLDGTNYNADQIRFINMIVDYLSDNGVAPLKRIYESPFVDVAPRGPEELFAESDLDSVFLLVRSFNDGVVPS